jgi:hypothetical protein
MYKITHRVIAALPANSAIGCPATPVFAAVTATVLVVLFSILQMWLLMVHVLVRILLLELGPLQFMW